ncbi:MAG: SRPBCC domain-containing protein [Armatimonadetes bacterium]|nr:SRPBCC domain-containing protein [Armatimonadota bacterium]
MTTKYAPDLSDRPHHKTLEHQMAAPADAVYAGWTEKFDLWFAQPGELIMTPEVDRPWFFYNRHDWGRHAHYGRFLELEKNRLVVTTWLTGPPGTAGDEAVLRVELTPNEKGTLVRLTHSGFSDEKHCQGHMDNWPAALEALDEALIATADRG